MVAAPPRRIDQRRGIDRCQRDCRWHYLDNFGMGVRIAATVMDATSSISPNAALFLGKCGGLKNVKIKRAI